MRKQEGCEPWGGDMQRSFFFLLKVTRYLMVVCYSLHVTFSPFEFLNCSSLCLFNWFVFLCLWLCLGLLFFYYSVFHLLFVIHSLVLSIFFLAPVYPSPERMRMLELFLSWITRINRRGQTEWVLRDNDWSDGSGCHQIVACLSLS